MNKNTKQKEMKNREKPFYRSTPKKNQNTQTGVYKRIDERVGFVDVINEATGEKKGYFVHSSKTGGAYSGDRVEIKMKFFKGREEAEIVGIIERSDKMIIGKLQIGKKFAFVIPTDPNAGKDIFIPGKHLGGYTHGEEVAVSILKWEGKSPEGRIMQSIQDTPKGREDIYRIALEAGARTRFPQKLETSLETIQQDGDIKNSSRKDLLSLFTFTIDGAESKDLDDALSLLETQQGYKLFVHIADVAHFVSENSLLDREARKRATSIYLADQVIPMLPKKLSNDLCSLHPETEKLTLTCEIDLDRSGNVKNVEVYESKISSDFRLTYKEVDEILGTSGDEKGIGDVLQFGGELTQQLQENMILLKKLTDTLRQNAERRGTLNFDFPETYVELDNSGQPVSYKEYIRYDSHKIIELCMVLANEQIGKKFSRIPFLYRVHEDPDPEDIETIVILIEKMSGTSIPGNNFGEILSYIQKNPKLSYLQRRLLRAMAKAKYSEKNLGHFGLALKYYSHFTSPIRRYSDLQIHRIIKDFICKHPISPSQKEKKKEFSPSIGRGDAGKAEGMTKEKKDHYKEILPKVAQICSDMSERAEKIEYKVRDMHGCKYMKDKVGQKFEGKISGVIQKGFFVELENTIEGFVEFGLTGYQMQEEGLGIMQISSQEVLYFGDIVEVILDDVDMLRYKLTFSFS